MLHNSLGNILSAILHWGDVNDFSETREGQNFRNFAPPFTCKFGTQTIINLQRFEKGGVQSKIVSHCNFLTSRRRQWTLCHNLQEDVYLNGKLIWCLPSH